MSPFVTSRRGSRILLFWILAVLVVLIAHANKTAVRVISSEEGYMSTLIPGVIDLIHVVITGVAFSMGEGAGSLFVIVALVVSCVAFAFVCTQDIPMSLTASVACVVGGGLGNMVDRLARGSVTDFIATAFIDFPVFNVADIAVTCGIAISLIGYLMWEQSLPPEERR